MYKKQILQMVGGCLAVLALAVLASADVVIEQKTTSTMMGGMFSSTGHSKIYLSGDKQKTDTEMKTEMSMFSAPTMKTTNIIRLDKEVAWNIDHAQKTYTELSFAQMRAMMSSAQAEQGEMGAQSGAPSAEDMEIQKPEFNIEKTGQKKKIMGYKCEEVILEVIVRARDKQTGDTGSFIMFDRMWVTADWAGHKEYEAYSKKAAQKMGFGAGMEAAGSSLAMMGLDPETMMEKMSEIGGFPMRQEMTMTISGDIKGQMETEGGQMTDEQKEAMKEASEALKGLGLGGLFGKQKEESEEKKEATVGSAAIFEAIIEVESVSTKDVDPGEFEVPKGYKKTGQKN